MSERPGVTWQEGIKNPKKLSQFFQSFLIWEMFQPLDNICGPLLDIVQSVRCLLYWTGTELVPLIQTQAHQYWIERMNPHAWTVRMPNWLIDSLLPTRNPRFSFAKLCSSQLTPQCTCTWDYYSSVAGLCNTLFWTSWDFSFLPISPICWGSSGWQHNSLEPLSSFELTLGLAEGAFCSIRSLMKMSNSFGPTSKFWGPSLVTDLQPDFASLITTLQAWSFRLFLIHFTVNFYIHPYFVSFSMMML